MLKEKYLPTGNEIVSLPLIDENTAQINSMNFLHMGYRGLVETYGCENPALPFLQPYLLVNEKEIVLSPENLKWQRLNYWIPRFTVEYEKVQFTGTYLTPIQERGFAIHFLVSNLEKQVGEIFVGLRGSWQHAYHSINESKIMNASRIAYPAKWGGGMMLEFARETSIFCLGLHTSEPLDVESWKVNNYPETIVLKQGQNKIVLDENNLNPIFWTLGKHLTLGAGESKELVFYFGLGLDEVGAATAALEMKRHGYQKIFQRTVQWLESHTLRLKGEGTPDSTHSETQKLETIMNLNSFFNYFYATGYTLDNEELVLITSRSPRYYVSAAYWDRDVLYWSLPAVLLIDQKKARELLERVFVRHVRNAGIHSHYIDGNMLEPGFELDELCAPIIALYHYIETTKDNSLLHLSHVKDGLKHIIEVLKSKKHPTLDLYETMLLPSDDVAQYPYVTYDNVLVWRMLNNMAEISILSNHPAEAEEYRKMAESTKKAVWENCVFNSEHGWLLAWATDLQDNFQVYDDPPGSLQLLPFHGFCSYEESVYQNTIEYLHSKDYKYSFAGTNFPTVGCDHFPHPACFSIANDMLSYRVVKGRELILKASLDNGIACESIDENTGELATGAAFATMAGFLAYAIYNSQVK